MKRNDLVIKLEFCSNILVSHEFTIRATIMVVVLYKNRVRIVNFDSRMNNLTISYRYVKVRNFQFPVSSAPTNIQKQ